MPRNGTGKYLLPPGINPVRPGTVIATNWANTTLDDIALAISNSLSKDGQTAWTGNQNANGNSITNLGPPTDDSSPITLEYFNGIAGTAGAISGVQRPEDHILPLITKVSDTVVFVPAGQGYIIDPISGRQHVEWAGGNTALTNTASSWSTTISIGLDGEVVQLAGNIKPEWARSYIILGTVTHINGQINTIENTPSIFGEVPYTTYDLAMASRNQVVSGNRLSGSAGGGLSLALSAGVLFFFGGSPNELNSPNYVDTPAQNPLTFFPVAGNSTSGASTSAVPVTKYDPDGAGSIEDIPGDGNASTIFRFYRLGSSFVMLYGQTVFASLAEATAAVYTETFVMPSKLDGATFIGALAVRKGAVNLNDPADSSITNPGGEGGGSGEGGTPLETEVIDGNGTVEGGSGGNNILLISTSAIPVTVTIKNSADGGVFSQGDTVSVLQWGAGQVTVVVEGPVSSLVPAEFFLTKTRGQGCVITAACVFPDTDDWSLAGDLAPGPEIGPGTGSGDVVGPSGAVNNGVALFDGTTGKLLKSGPVLAAIAYSGSVADLQNFPGGTLQFLRADGTWATPAGGGGGSGTVTSVNVAVPAGFEVSGGPITSSGTITISYEAGYRGFTNSESSKLGSIAAGATVGATWGTNLNSIPANITAWASFAPSTKLDTTATAAAATKLATARTINGVSFDGTANITVPAGGSPIVAITSTSTTLGLTHAGKTLRCSNSSAQTITIPPQSSVAWEDNTQMDGGQFGTGAVTFVAGSGVTIQRKSSKTNTTDGQYSPFGLKRMAENEWWLFGELGAAP